LYSRFESTSDNTATYSVEGALSYVGTISTFVQLGAIEMDTVLYFDPFDKTFDIKIRTESCYVAPSAYPSSSVELSLTT
jgi:hypothetical protein